MTNLYCATPSAHSQLSYVFTSIYLFLEGLEITHLFYGRVETTRTGADK